MALHNFNAAYGLAESLYGIDLTETDFEDIALDGWEQIGNKHTRLYRYIGDTVNKELKLPCNVDLIESVHIPLPDAQLTSNHSELEFMDSVWTEGYIDFRKWNNDPYYSRGRLIKYNEGDGVLYFSRDYKHVKVIYHGIIMDDEDNLPLLNDKELRAVAAYVAYISLTKEGIQKRDGNILKLGQALETKWLKLCNAARVAEYLTQNDMDRILDAKVRWDRKQYGKSSKPIL